MTPLLGWLVKLYPKEWRGRYGDEFGALLADVPFRWTHVFDIISGAVVMQMRNPLAILTMGLIAGGLAGGAAVAVRSDVYESRADVLIDGFDLRKTDANGHLTAFERALEPLSEHERSRVGIEWRVALADGTPIKGDQTLLRLTAHDSSPAAAQRLTQRLTRNVQDVTEAALVLAGPSLPDAPVLPPVPRGMSLFVVVNGCLQGLFVAYVWLLLAPRMRNVWLLLASRRRRRSSLA